MTSDTIRVDFEIFEHNRLKSDGSNYRTWKTMIELVLTHHGLLGYIDGSEVKPTPSVSPDTPSTSRTPAATPRPAAMTPEGIWKKGNSEALLQIMVSIDDGVMALITNTEDASKAWTIIKNRFEGNGIQLAVRLLEKLFRSTIQPEKDIVTQIQGIERAALRLNSLGYPISEEVQAVALIMSLPEEWKALRTVLVCKPPSTVQSTIDSILSYDRVLKQQREEAMAGRGRLTCANCKKRGHTAEQCWAKGGGAEGKSPKRNDVRGKAGKKLGSG